MSELVWGHGEGYFSQFPGSGDHFVHRLTGQRAPSLGGEHKRAAIVPHEPPKRPEFVTLERMGAVNTLLEPPYVDLSGFQVNVSPFQANQLTDP